MSCLSNSDYYSICNMDCPTPEMYNASGKVLLVGTARPQSWALTIDVDPLAPCDMVCNGKDMPFKDKVFDLVILDFVTNFAHPSEVQKIISEANRVGKKVMGRCHISPTGKTLSGPKQAHCHKFPPSGVEWIETREHV